jgi:RimJ/RimL family protein N-acetyltransferase
MLEGLPLQFTIYTLLEGGDNNTSLPCRNKEIDEMIEITSDQVTPALRALFRKDEPQAQRCFSVLDGVDIGGKILCNDPIHPTWAVVQESCDHMLHFGGSVDAQIIAAVFETLRQEGGVLVGMWLDDPRQSLLPPNPDYDGRTLQFYDRPIGEGLEQYMHPLPEGTQVHRLDRDLIMRTQWGPNDVAMRGGLDAWEKTCIGYCLMIGDEVVSEATDGPPAIGLHEPGVITHPDYRGKGYGTIVVAYLIQEIESSGGRTLWDCAKQNVASAAIARKMGYRIEKEYRCMAWEQLNGA